jgi:hypothetical protein
MPPDMSWRGGGGAGRHLAGVCGCCLLSHRDPGLSRDDRTPSRPGDQAEARTPTRRAQRGKGARPRTLHAISRLLDRLPLQRDTQIKAAPFLFSIQTGA